MMENEVRALSSRENVNVECIKKLSQGEKEACDLAGYHISYIV